MNQQEQWRPVIGFDGYEVSNLGRIMSFRRHVRPYLMRGALKSPDGYRMVQLRDGISGGRLRLVHCLVAEAFIGPRPEGSQVRHLDGDKSNNIVSNLTYGTASENAYDQVRHGVHHVARRTHCPQGHEYSPQNTYIHKLGGRRCRICVLAANRRARERRAFRAANVRTAVTA